MMVFQFAKCLGAPHGTKPWCLPEVSASSVEAPSPWPWPMPETCVSTRRRRSAETGQLVKWFVVHDVV